MKLKPDDDDSFEFTISSDDFSEEEKDMIFSNPLDDPELHLKCEDPELCEKEECIVYLGGEEIAKIQKKSNESYDDILEELNQNN